MRTAPSASQRVIFAILAALVMPAGGGAARAAQASAPQTPDPPAAIARVTLIGTEFAWSPRTIVVRPGQRVQFRVVNTGTISHSFAGDRARLPKPREIAPGRSETVDWKAPSRPGSFEFWCDVPGHREAGMVGTIAVK